MFNMLPDNFVLTKWRNQSGVNLISRHQKSCTLISFQQKVIFANELPEFPLSEKLSQISGEYYVDQHPPDRNAACEEEVK